MIFTGSVENVCYLASWRSLSTLKAYFSQSCLFSFSAHVPIHLTHWSIFISMRDNKHEKSLIHFFASTRWAIFFYSSEKFPIASWQRNESYRSVSVIPESSLLLMYSMCLQDINNSDHWVYRHIGSSSRFTLQMARLFVWGNERPLHDTHSPQSETRPDFILSRQFSPFRSVDTISFVKSVLIFCSSNFDSNFAREITLRYRISFIISRRVFEKVHYGN